MPRLAIVISAIGTTESLEATLVSVLENRPADCEILVVLERHYCDPYGLDGEVHYVRSAKRAPWTARLNEALAATRAPFVHLLASGCTVSEGWAEHALARFGDRQVASVAPLAWDASCPDRILAAGLGYHPCGRRFLVARGQTQLPDDAEATILGACGFAGFFRKSALDLVGGLCTALGPGQADADLASALASAGFSVVVEPNSRVFAMPQVDQAGTSTFRQALCEERLFWRNLGGTGRAGALVSHAGLVTLQLARSFPRPRMFLQLAGRILACCQVGSYARHRAVLAQLGRRAAAEMAARQGRRVDRLHAASSIARSAATRAASRAGPPESAPSP